MSDILTTITTRTRLRNPVPQSQPRTRDQVKNAAGGYAYKAGDELRLHRFLTLGTDGSTYYTSAKELTRQNAEVLFRMVHNKGLYTVEEIAKISEAGRAPKNKQAIFALAVAAAEGDQATKIAAYAAMPRVIRTGTHLFEFLNYSMQFRGWGMGLRKAVARWYADKDVDRLAYQVLKYRQREGVTHWDVFRQSHLTAYTEVTPEQAALYNWVCNRATVKNENSPRFGKAVNVDREGRFIEANLPVLVEAFEVLQSTDSLRTVVDLIGTHQAISWEMIPDRFINEAKVWEALLANGLPQTALLRQLPRLTRLGLGSGSVAQDIVTQLTDHDRLKKARVHPINVLVAMRTYASGTSERGSSTWTPSRLFTDGLDATFYAAYDAVEAAGVRTLEALDISGSMSWQNVSGLPITPREASAALAMVSLATEPDAEVVGFTSGGWSMPGKRHGYYGSGISKLDISPRRRLDDNLRYIERQAAGGTDCALPMVWAKNAKESFGAFRIYTDNETWAGNIHVDQALEQYRQAMGINARLEIVSMTAAGQSLCNPEDPGQLDVSGFDSTVPQLLADHSAGRL